MRKIGLIGGLSWVSTAAYYRRINQLTEARRGGVHSAPITLESVDRQRYVDAVITHRDEMAACEQIRAAAKNLERAGADFIVITCNDVHRFIPMIEPAVDRPFLHIADATGDAIAERGLRRVALLGVRKTMESDFYPERLAAKGIETLIPAEAEKAYVHDTIYEELVKDRFLDKIRAGYQRLIADFAKRGAEGVILGCTEIPLLLAPEDIDLPAFSTTELHCRAAVETALAD